MPKGTVKSATVTGLGTKKRLNVVMSSDRAMQETCVASATSNFTTRISDHQIEIESTATPEH